jgi:hypothetical protein
MITGAGFLAGVFFVADEEEGRRAAEAGAAFLLPAPFALALAAAAGFLAARAAVGRLGELAGRFLAIRPGRWDWRGFERSKRRIEFFRRRGRRLGGVFVFPRGLCLCARASVWCNKRVAVCVCVWCVGGR